MALNIYSNLSKPKFLHLQTRNNNVYMNINLTLKFNVNMKTILNAKACSWIAHRNSSVETCTKNQWGKILNLHKICCCWHIDRLLLISTTRHLIRFWNWGFSGDSEGKESACNARYLNLIPELGRSTGEGNDYPLQYSRLENSMGRAAWWAVDCGVPKVLDMTKWLAYIFAFKKPTVLQFPAMD